MSHDMQVKGWENGWVIGALLGVAVLTAPRWMPRAVAISALLAAYFILV